MTARQSRRIGFLLAAVLAALSGAAWAADAPAAAPADDEAGFRTLFNGKDLTGWEGDSRLWSVSDGAIHGETTAEKAAQGNTFLIWKGAKPKDFILRLKFRVGDANNSGVQFRSSVVGQPGSRNPWVVSGYQAEVNEGPGHVGLLYHERGRKRLASVGEFVILDAKDGEMVKEVAGQVGEPKQMIQAGYYKSNKTPEWNEYEITCRGNHVMMKLNGVQTVELIDNDKAGRCMEGVLALQLHAGAPMSVDFKDIRLKDLPPHYGEAVRLFNGKDLTGWTYSSDAQKDVWSVKDGVLCDAGRPAGYLRTEADYRDFIVRMQVRHLSKGNGGVLLRMTGKDGVWPRSIECQGMVDNKGDIFNIGQFPMKTDPARTGGRRTKKMHPSNEKPLGEWNEYELMLDGGRLEIRVNGLLQNFADDCEHIAGKICLQSEGSRMEYRNIVLIPIQKAKD